MLGGYVALIHLSLCVFLPGLMTISQLYKYEKGWGAKSVLPGTTDSQKHGINTVKFCGCQNGVLRLKLQFFHNFMFLTEIYPCWMVRILSCCWSCKRCKFKLICYMVLRQESNSFLPILLGIEFCCPLIKKI